MSNSIVTKKIMHLDPSVLVHQLLLLLARLHQPDKTYSITQYISVWYFSGAVTCVLHADKLKHLYSIDT
jgi:hypothetical protein